MPRSVREILEHADELVRRFESHEPQPGDQGNTESLASLRGAVLERSAAERKLQQAVERARTEGHSWAAVGKIIGTTGEAARQRYGNKQDG